MSFFGGFNDKVFGESEYEKPYENYEYVPVFGVGTLTESMTWSAMGRPLQFTEAALKYYNIKEEDKNSPNLINNKQIAIVRRIVKDSIKIDSYHAPNHYTVDKMNYPWMYSMCTVNVKCSKTNKIEKEINIGRIVIPILIQKYL